MNRNRTLAAAALMLAVVSLTACTTKTPDPTPAPAPGPVQADPPKPATPAAPNPGQTISNPPPGQPLTEAETVDVAVRKVLTGYLDTLNRGDWPAAAGYWSAAANVTPESLKAPGVSEWHFLSSEMISSTADGAQVQLNFTVKVAPGANTKLQDGRNVRFVTLRKEGDAWKITAFAEDL